MNEPRQSIEAFLVERIARRLGMDRADVPTEIPFEAIGLDSAAAVELSGELEELVGRALPATLLYEHPTIAELTVALEEPGPERAEGTLTPIRDRSGDQLAIVGLGCRVPGGTGTPRELWDLVCAGVDAIGPIPEGRWALEGVPSDVPRTGGFLESVEMFDPEVFSISPREAAAMDPQQRLLLEVTWEALEDAMIAPSSVDGSNTGVFVGVSATDWGQMILDDMSAIDRYATTGSALSIVANRVSYAFNLLGPSIAVDSACSSSLVALDLARRTLQSGDCDLALVGGVNLLLRPNVSLALSRSRMLSHDGRCRSFAMGADGFGRGEGAAVAVLKTLDSARADHDRIYAVLRGSAVGSDGRTNGLSAPSGRGQRAVLRAAYADAGVPPSDVSYVEAQGTGTALGDAIEAEALGAVLGQGRPLDRPCAIGSVKSNIGHLEAASGAVALAKTALALHHRILPASVHGDRVRDDIPFDLLGLRVQATTSEWPREWPLLAGVSGFGFGGTNAHAVLSGT